ncbi:MAG: hypothetical protein JSV03_10890 [Planctomycetota bacterium]|nr:MAG: hypothetical protein JSV03_10890 [Planctomycetota bacterium]
MSSSAGGGNDVDFVAKSIEEAVDIVLKHTGRPQGVEDSAKDEAGGGDGTAVLQEILSFLRMIDRRSRAEDFSLARMVGAFVQLLALVVLTMAIFGVIKGDEELLGVQLVRLLFGIFLQLIALTFFLISSRK